MGATAVVLHPDLFGGETPVITPEMLRPVLLRLGWNDDPRHHVGEITLCVPERQHRPLLELSTEGWGTFCHWSRRSSRQELQLGRHLYQILEYRRTRRDLGWDDVVLTAQTAAELLTNLQTQRKAWGSVGGTRLSSVWDLATEITLADLTAALEEVPR
jgi:hypothetical protein